MNIVFIFLFLLFYFLLGGSIIYRLLEKNVELNFFSPLQGIFLLVFWPYFAIVWLLYK
jgi:hypothetical protein